MIRWGINKIAKYEEQENPSPSNNHFLLSLHPGISLVPSTIFKEIPPSLSLKFLENENSKNQRFSDLRVLMSQLTLLYSKRAYITRETKNKKLHPLSKCPPKFTHMEVQVVTLFIPSIPNFNIMNDQQIKNKT